jgi:hypothetical protein
VTREGIEGVVGFAFFVAFVAAHFFFGITVAVRVMGVGCIVGGTLWAKRRSVPVGIEGEPPSFYIRGTGATLIGIALTILGLALLVFANEAACIVGWAKGSQCA